MNRLIATLILLVVALCANAICQHRAINDLRGPALTLTDARTGQTFKVRERDIITFGSVPGPPDIAVMFDKRSWIKLYRYDFKWITVSPHCPDWHELKKIMDDRDT